MESKFKIENVLTDFGSVEKSDDSLLITYIKNEDAFNALFINEDRHLDLLKVSTKPYAMRVGIWRKVSEQRILEIKVEKMKKYLSEHTELLRKDFSSYFRRKLQPSFGVGFKNTNKQICDQLFELQKTIYDNVGTKKI